MGYDNRIQNGTHDCREPAIAQGSKGKAANRVSAAQSKQSKGQSNIKDDQQLVLPGTPSMGPDTLNLYI
jgi:hypothetical protein